MLPLRAWRDSVRVRITAVVVLVTAFAVAAGGWGLMRSIEDTQLGRISRDVEARLDAVVAQLESGVPPDAILAAGAAGGGSAGFVQVLDESGQVLGAAPSYIPPTDIVVVANDPAGGGVVERPLPGQSAAAIPIEFRYERVRSAAGDQWTVVAASPLDEVRRSLDAVERSLWVGLPWLVALAGGIAWLAVGRALRPVEAMRREVAAVEGSSLHRRVPEPEADDEVGRLARTMNDMLERLEQSAERQRQFVADASHELRSPVATLRAELEVAQRAGRVDALKAGVAAALAEEARLEALLADLLLLASIEDGPPPAPAPVDLGVLMAEEAERPRRVPVTADVGDRAALVAATPGPLRRVVANLLDNGARHARTAVSASVRVDDGRAVLIVDDDGPGIPEADRERVFERFVRLDEARSRDAGGSGLGLALVQAVAEGLGGDVRIETAPAGGARLVVSLPAGGDERALA